MQDYHQLEIWQRGMSYAVEIYRYSAQLPESERYNLVAQIRKATTSVPLNIAEGAGCSTSVEFSRFLGYAYRLLQEVITRLELCRRLHPVVPDLSADGLIDEGNQLSRMIQTLMRRLGESK